MLRPLSMGEMGMNCTYRERILRICTEEEVKDGEAYRILRDGKPGSTFWKRNGNGLDRYHLGIKSVLCSTTYFATASFKSQRESTKVLVIG